MVIEFDVVSIVNFENFEWDAFDLELALERLRENALGLAGKIILLSFINDLGIVESKVMGPFEQIGLQVYLVHVVLDSETPSVVLYRQFYEHAFLLAAVGDRDDFSLRRGAKISSHNFLLKFFLSQIDFSLHTKYFIRVKNVVLQQAQKYFFRFKQP
jgi:hypothetical protein